MKKINGTEYIKAGVIEDRNTETAFLFLPLFFLLFGRR